MAVGALPVVKLAILAARQLSKPVANNLKEAAKRVPIFRNYVCLPIAQFYHWAETQGRMVLMGLGKPQKVTPLNEQMAVELGADIIGEVFIYGVAAAALTWEYTRYAARSRAKEEDTENRIVRMETALVELDLKCERQRAQIREFERNIAAMKTSPLKALKEKLIPSSPHEMSEIKLAPGTETPSSPAAFSASEQSRTSPIEAIKESQKKDESHIQSTSSAASSRMYEYNPKTVRRALKILMNAYEEVYDED